GTIAVIAGIVVGLPVAGDAVFVDDGALEQAALAVPVPGAVLRLAVLGDGDHLVIAEIGFARPGPADHDRAARFVVIERADEAVDQVVANPDAVAFENAVEIANLLAAVGPGVDVALAEPGDAV